MMKDLSIIIPAFNEENRLAGTIEKIKKFLITKRIKYEIIVVDDGSSDNTVKIAKKIKGIIILKNKKNMGKGYSVKKGVMKAQGVNILFSDADLSTPIKELDRLMKYIKNYDIAIGSRALKGSRVRLYQPMYRVLMGKIFNMMARLLAVKKIKDTQCGFKLFRRFAAKDIFNRQRLNGFSFDVEILHLAQERGYSIKEVPIEWINDVETKVNPGLDSIKMFMDLIRIRFS